MRRILSLILLVVGFGASAQYWFGPKIGGQRTDFVYQDKDYKVDSFNVKPDYGFHAGLVVIYQATDRYAVHGELLWERLSKEVTELEDSDVPVSSKSHYNYLSVPFTLRWNFGAEPIHFYVGGGPKISFWLGGTGILDLDELNEASGEPIDYRFVFRQKNSDPPNKLAIEEANRFQYALTANTGMYLDLTTGGRLSIDLRYSFGHSNVGFNNNPDFNQFVTYSENFRYRQNIFSVSLAYLFEYDIREQSRGMSTISDSNDKTKHRKPKRRRKN